MYREGEPAFCRACGSAWTPGNTVCASCQEPLKASATVKTARPKFRDQSVRTRHLSIALAVCATTALAAAYTDVNQIELFDNLYEGGAFSLEGAEANDQQFMAAFAFNALAFLATAGLFLTWIFEAGRNLRAIGRSSMRFSEESRVWWFFVPVAHLIMPLLGIRELLKASLAPLKGDWSKTGVPLFLGLWWLLWIGSNACGDYAVFQLYGDPDIDMMYAATKFDLASNLGRVACIPFVIAMVRRVNAGQNVLAAKAPGVERSDG